MRQNCRPGPLMAVHVLREAAQLTPDGLDNGEGASCPRSPRAGRRVLALPGRSWKGEPPHTMPLELPRHVLEFTMVGRCGVIGWP